MVVDVVNLLSVGIIVQQGIIDFFGQCMVGMMLLDQVNSVWMWVMVGIVFRIDLVMGVWMMCDIMCDQQVDQQFVWVKLDYDCVMCLVDQQESDINVLCDIDQQNVDYFKSCLQQGNGVVCLVMVDDYMVVLQYKVGLLI